MLTSLAIPLATVLADTGIYIGGGLITLIIVVALVVFVLKRA